LAIHNSITSVIYNEITSSNGGGRGTETVNGICVVIIQEQSWFDRLFSWLGFR